MKVFQSSLPFKWLALCADVFAPDKNQATSQSPLSLAWFKVLAALSGGDGIHTVELAIRKVKEQFDSMLLEALREALQILDAKLANPPCPHCHRPMWRNRLESLTIQVLEGKIKFLRRYTECRPCGIHLHPLDVWLGLPDEGECAPQFGEDLCLLAVHLPGKTAVDVLAALTGRHYSRSGLKQQVERDGGALVELEREEAESLWPWDEKGHIKPVQPVVGLALHAPPPPARGCIIELDGVLANLGRDPAIIKELEQYEDAKKVALAAGASPPKDAPSRFREVRQARIYRLEDRATKRTRSGRLRTELTRSETVSVVHDPEYFQKRVQALIHSWKVDRYKFSAVLGDGGEFIWTISRTIIHPTYEILDIQHARSHIHTCGRVLHGEDSAQARAWAKRWCDSVYEHGPVALLAELARLQEQKLSTETHRVVKNLSDYVTEHQHRMNYPQFRALGLPIASGAIESANRQVVGDRCKRSGMGWSRDGLQRLVSLRAAYLSENWGRVFDAIRSRRAIRAPARVSLLPPEPPSIQIQPAAVVSEITPTVAVLTDHEVAARLGIPDRKIPSLLLSGYLRRNPYGQLEEVQ